VKAPSTSSERHAAIVLGILTLFILALSAWCYLADTGARPCYLP
jgi:hypothetical protein